MKEYDTFILKKDLNPVIQTGMRGCILEIYDEENVEVEFPNKDGSNYKYEGQYTFAIKTNSIEIED
jgi:hypothetical protein